MEWLQNEFPTQNIGTSQTDENYIFVKVLRFAATPWFILFLCLVYRAQLF